MAVIPQEPPVHPTPSPGEALLATATGRLRDDVDTRWVEISDHVLSAALTASRRSALIRTPDAEGRLRVSTQVVIAYLHEALDGAAAGTAVAGLDIRLDEADAFAGVVVELTVQYGVAILPAADRVRAITSSVLREVLGLDVVDVAVRTTHVHVGDVTELDPRVVDPRDVEPVRGPTPPRA